MRTIGLCLFLTAVSVTSCSTPQEIDITSEPSDALVEVDGEAIGNTPCTLSLEDVDDYDRIKIVVSKRDYESEMKVLRKKVNGLYPDLISVILTPKVTALELKAREQAVGAAGQQAQGQQSAGQMMGPTIVIPGSGPVQQTTNSGDTSSK